MRRSLIALLAALMLAALVPSAALAAKPVGSFRYVGVLNDLVSSEDTVGVWNTPSGEDDYVFALTLAPTTGQDVLYLTMTAALGTWNTIDGDNVWAIGVTDASRKATTLLNQADSFYTADLDGGLKVYLHLEGGGLIYKGRELCLAVSYDTGSSDTFCAVAK